MPASENRGTPNPVKLTFTVFLVAIVSSALSSAQTGGPILYPKGEVTVNGKLSTRPSPLFVGDKIQTAAMSSATLTALGSNVLVFPSSSLVYESNRVEIGCGQVSITTVVKRMSARVSNLMVSATSDAAKYEISHTGGRLQIAAQEGSVEIGDGAQTTALDGGKAITFTTGNECSAAVSSSETPSETRSIETKTAGFGKGKVLLLVGGAGGAAVAAIVISHGGGNSKPPISPVQP
jgi:hypothetical protein